jgi:CheY-like chemotaxis protein
MAAPGVRPTRTQRLSALAAARDPAEMRLIREALGRHWRVHAARSPAAASRAAVARQFDLMVLSCTGSALAGLETARRLRRLRGRRGDCAIIAVTRRADPAFVDAAAEAGIDGFVEAPAAARRLPGLIALLAPKTAAGAGSVDAAEIGDVQQ